MFRKLAILISLLVASFGSVLAQSVTPGKTSYTVGESIVINFAGGPGNAKDWIGIYTNGVTPDGNPASLDWRYTNGTQTSGGNATAGSVTFPAPVLAAGTYKIWFLANDAYGVIAGPTDLVITPPTVPDGPPVWVTSPIRFRHGVAGTAYTGLISAYASDPQGTALTFSKTSGPAWLTVAANGALGGTPAAGDAGMNTFTIRASDGTETADATVNLQVFAVGAELPVNLKVISYNLWHGFGQINNGHRKGIESVILSDADIIATQETVDNASGAGTYQAQKIAQDLGWYYGPTTAGDSGIVSRYPIMEVLPNAGVAKGIRVQVAASPAREVILFNCHLDYLYYGPYAARLPGATAASVLTEEKRSQRDEQIAAIMTGMAGYLANADVTPVLLTGDFNAPSHLDWTPATAASHGGVSGVAWPASTAVHHAGMLDSFRVIHPDPAAVPGNSWSPLYTGDAADRIDFVYYKGKGLRPLDSKHFHTAIEVTLGAWGASTTPARNNTWPSDHGAMLTDFFLEPADSDNDGLADAFEIEHFGSITAEDGDGDPDGDGKSNAVEQSSGSSPTQADPAPPVKVDPPSGASLWPTLRFDLSPLAMAAGWVCERTADLDQWTPVWSYRADPRLESPLITVNDEVAGKWSVDLIDSTTAAADRVFYRMRSGQ